jgi:hypothetical protein
MNADCFQNNLIHLFNLCCCQERVKNMLHVLLLVGAFAMPMGLLLLTFLQVLLMRRFREQRFNFLIVLQLESGLLTPREQLLRRYGAGLLAFGLVLVIVAGTALFFGWAA